MMSVSYERAAAVRRWLGKLMNSSGQIKCDSVVNTARFRKFSELKIDHKTRFSFQHSDQAIDRRHKQTAISLRLIK